MTARPHSPLQVFVDALREALGLGPLYGRDSPTPQFREFPETSDSVDPVLGAVGTHLVFQNMPGGIAEHNARSVLLRRAENRRPGSAGDRAHAGYMRDRSREFERNR